MRNVKNGIEMWKRAKSGKKRGKKKGILRSLEIMEEKRKK